MKRKLISPFSLSFLDIMFCGFGAVVLLVLILNNDTVQVREATFADLRTQVVTLERELFAGRQTLTSARNNLDTMGSELSKAESEAKQVRGAVETLKLEISTLSEKSMAAREHVKRLSSDLRSLDEEKKRLGALAAADKGRRVHRFIGEGDRQYVTGMRMGGRRILILLDASASMLDETIVNVIRRRNMGDAEKRNAPKWRRALSTTEWLVSNLPADAHFQIYTFNTRAAPALKAGAGTWLAASKPQDVEAALRAAAKTIPAGGTSLYNAFAAAGELAPRPDNIFLITDGLPTQGRTKPSASTVSGQERLGHFRRAQAKLPAGVPVNTILLPMEGDAYAAAAYWKLAVDTAGSFLTPARDWP